MAEEEKPDPRPRPKYGELAPEGWRWVPPEDVERLDTSRPVVPPPGAETETPGTPAPTEERPPGPAWLPPAGPRDDGERRAASPYARRGAPAWDRGVTIVLLIVGLFGMFISIATIKSLPQSIQLVYTSKDLGTYHPAASVAGLLIAAQIIQVVIWLASAVLAILLLTRRRMAFYVPLLAGLVAGIVLVILMSVIVTGDPTLLNYGNSL